VLPQRGIVEVTAPADAIPDYFEFNLEGLEIGRSVHISATTMPDGVKPTIINRDFTVATIAGHKIEDETTTTPDAAAAVEGAPAAEATEAAAAPAAGDGKAAAAGKEAAGKAPAGKEAAKPAAAKPAAGKK